MSSPAPLTSATAHPSRSAPGVLQTPVPFLWIAAAFAVGILLDRCWAVGSWGIGVSPLALGVWYVLFRQERWAAAALCLLLAVAGLGSFWHHAWWNWYSVNEVSRYCDVVPIPVAVRGTLASEPHPMAVPEDESLNPLPPEERTRLLFRYSAIRDGAEWRPAAGTSYLIVHDRANHLRSGDEVTVYGVLAPVRAPANPGQFDFRTFYRARRMLCVLHAYRSSAVQPCQTEGWRWRSPRLMSELRRRFNAGIWKHVSESRAGLASAILLGSREQLGRDRRDRFLQTGTVHLLAISGLHVGILAGVFFLLFRIGFAQRRTALWATIAFVIFYAWLVEFRPPVTRAAILLTLICLGRLFGKSGWSFNLWGLAALIVLLLNPADLFELGAQLSFLAVASLICFEDWIVQRLDSDPLSRLVRNTRPWPVRAISLVGRRCRQVVAVSAVIWLVSLPLVAHSFHLVTPVSLLANPLVLLPMTMALYAGLVVMICDSWFPWAAALAGWLCDTSLEWLESIVGWFQSLPGGHDWCAGPNAVAVAVFYVGLLGLVVGLTGTTRRKGVVVWGIVWVALAWMLPETARDIHRRAVGTDRLTCTFIDVGHGTSVWIQTPRGRNVLYDAGTFGSPDFGVETISRALWSEGVDHLDAVVLSHADVDHFNALPQLAERISIGRVYVSPQMTRRDVESVRALTAALRRHQVGVTELLRGDRLLLDSEVDARVLAPSRDQPAGSDNSDSVVLWLAAYGRTMLLPGDLEGPGLDALLATTPLPCDVVMAPHHGSLNSDPDRFLAWARPRNVVLSARPDRVPFETYRLIQASDAVVKQTGLPGSVRYVVDSTGQIQTFQFFEGRWRRSLRSGSVDEYHQSVRHSY